MFSNKSVILFVLGIIFTSSNVSSEGVKCGRPGRPTNGTISPLGKSYYPGEKVAYACLEGFVLFGGEESTCLKNGSWTGTVPLCDFNLAKGKKGLQSDTLWSYNPDLAVDGNPDTCSFTPRGPEPRWWQVHLGHKYNVVSVGVTISPGSFQEFTIYVIELLADNKALYKPCTTFRGVFQTHKGLFKCNDGLGHPGQFVYIRDDRKEEEYFGLCEVEVFAFRERIPCGDPEVPVNGEVDRTTEDQSTYSCQRGFKLEGDSVLKCSSQGKWQGHAPKCKEVKCEAPPHTENGYIEIGNPKGEYVYGTEARYGCSPGHKIRGNSLRICGEKGLWSGTDPTCQAVECGDPPTFPNARYTLLNGTNSWTGIAVYTCAEGHKLLYEEEDTVTTCLDNGEWRFINVTCVLNPSVNAIARHGYERSLNYEILTETSKREATPHMVLVLAVLAGVLATIMVIGVVVLIRKRLLSGEGSLSPLMRALPKENCYEHKPKESPSTGNGQNPPNKGFCPTYANFPQSEQRSQVSLTSEDSCYERLGPENNYETLNKKELVMDDKISYGYEEISKAQSFNEDNQYEIVKEKEPGYETIAGQPQSEPGYETVSENAITHGYEAIQNQSQMDPGYEVVSERSKNHDPGYEIVSDKSRKKLTYEPVYGSSRTEPGYEIVSESKIHGYETIKPKLPPPNGIPDILQNLESQENNSSSMDTENVAPEILALYAKVDKSKKIKNLPKQTTESVQTKMAPALEHFHTPLSSQNSLASESSCTSGTLRPLPPIPK